MQFERPARVAKTTRRVCVSYGGIGSGSNRGKKCLQFETRPITISTFGTKRGARPYHCAYRVPKGQKCNTWAVGRKGSPGYRIINPVELFEIRQGARESAKIVAKEKARIRALNRRIAQQQQQILGFQ